MLDSQPYGIAMLWAFLKGWHRSSVGMKVKVQAAHCSPPGGKDCKHPTARRGAGRVAVTPPCGRYHVEGRSKAAAFPAIRLE